MSERAKAGCKINIGLDVLRRRADGYHDIETVMYPVHELCDEIEVERCGCGVRFVQNGIAVDCDDEQNLCVRAYRLMQELFGIDGAEIRLDKRIPFGAGLGGGSSDATTTILLLNKLFGLALSEPQLMELATMLGSDTAFFVRNEPQLCSGRGEVLTPIHLPIAGKWLAILKPAEGVSTREAYEGVRPAVPSIPLAEALQQPIGEWRECVKNDFEPHVFAVHPRIAQLKQYLYGIGASYASMSGSGSAVFGIFAEQPHIVPPFENTFIHTEKLR